MERRRLMLLGLIATALLLLPTVIGHGPHHPGPPGHDEGTQADEAEEEDEGDQTGQEGSDDTYTRERDRVHVSADDDGALFRLQRVDGDLTERTEATFLAPEGRFHMTYDREAPGAEEHLEQTVVIHRVVEFVDVDDDGRFEEGVDEVASSYDLSTMDWEVDPVQTVDASGDTVGKRVRAVGQLGQTQGRFAVVITAFGDFTEVNGTDLAPTDLKIDFVFSEYPFRYDDTRLALDLEHEVKAREAVEDRTEDDGLTVRVDDVEGYFDWVDTATVDGTATPVRSEVDAVHRESHQRTGPEGAKSEVSLQRDFTLAYGHGDHIVHDPVLGASTQSAGTSALSTAAPAVALILMVGGLAAGLVAWRGRSG